jgi:hypothetical protein
VSIFPNPNDELYRAIEATFAGVTQIPPAYVKPDESLQHLFAVNSIQFTHILMEVDHLLWKRNPHAGTLPRKPEPPNDTLGWIYTNAKQLLDNAVQSAPETKDGTA